MSSKNVDRLSCLPEEVLSTILSLMPIKFAVRTSILSKRWEYSWTLVTNLDFHDFHPFLGLNAFTKFVYRVLEHHKASQIRLFRLRFNEIWVKRLDVSKWINEAVKLNVSELDLQVVQLGLPINLFTCTTLTSLRLILGDFDYDYFEFPSSVNLPCLKTLEIAVFGKPSVNAFNLIRGCSVLESLCLEIVCDECEEYNFNIPTLKRFTLRFMKRGSVKRIVLHFPNLEYLFFGGRFLYSSFVMNDISWLLISQFLEMSSPLEHLCIEKAEDSCWVQPNSVPPCMLTNLTTIEFNNCKGRMSDIQFLEYVLENAEVLKTLTINFETLSLEEEMSLRAKLLKFPKASGCCEIQFVGNQSHSSTS